MLTGNPSGLVERTFVFAKAAHGSIANQVAMELVLAGGTTKVVDIGQ